MQDPGSGDRRGGTDRSWRGVRAVCDRGGAIAVHRTCALSMPGNTYLNTTIAELRLSMMWTANTVFDHGRAIVGVQRGSKAGPRSSPGMALDRVAVISRA
jgi:hypothetical protein